MTMTAGKIFLNGQTTLQQPVIYRGNDYTTINITSNEATLEVHGDGVSVDNCNSTPSGLFMRININGTFYRMPLYEDK